ncbi:MAG TPA: (Fe-S)-binding protein [Acidimicrobiales bacterium]|nr:(Fe-S)-binding protein [Acidimicrobiales bacterium]
MTDESTEDPLRVSFLITCVVDIVAPEVGEAAVRTLRAARCTVSCDLSQTCCGQPAWNAGFAEDAAAVARPTLAALEAELGRGAEYVVVPAGSCATMVRLFWPELFEIVGDPDAAARARRVGERTREWSELLAERAASLPKLRLSEPRKVVLHQSCHRQRELDVTPPLARLLGLVDGCETVEWTGADRCCGFGGASGVTPPDASEAMTDEKLRALVGVDPDVLVGCDTSCLLHLRGRADALGTPVEVRHVAQILQDALPVAVARSGA